MELDALVREYEECRKINEKWYKDNQPRYIKTATKVLKITGIISVMLMIVGIFFTETVVYRAVALLIAVLLIGVVFFVIWKRINKKEKRENDECEESIRDKQIANGRIYRKKQMRSLKKILKKNNILSEERVDSESIQRIEVLINLIIDKKKTIIGLGDLKAFIVKPITYIIVPVTGTIIKTLISGWDPLDQFSFLMYLILLVFAVAALIYFICDPIKSLIVGKYDRLIDDLHILVVFFGEEE